MPTVKEGDLVICELAIGVDSKTNHKMVMVTKVRPDQSFLPSYCRYLLVYHQAGTIKYRSRVEVDSNLFNGRKAEIISGGICYE